MSKGITLLIAFLLLTFNGQTQDIDSLGIDDKPFLNKQEIAFLNKSLHDKLGNLDLTAQKVAFITGSSGNRLLYKSDYFNSYVKPWLREGTIPRISLIRLKPAEKQRSGGYDVLILSWVKVFTDGRKNKIINQLGASSKQ